MRRIGGLFGRSPFGPIHEHMLKVQECVERLDPLLDAFLLSDTQRIADLTAEIDRLEGEADDIKNEIREQVSDSMFSSVERGDLMYLLKVQDNIADACQDAARMLDLRRIPVPEPLVVLIKGLGQKADQAVASLAAITRQLRKVLSSSFDKTEVQKVLDRTTEVRELEFAAEQQAQATLKELFRVEDQLDPVSVILLSKIVRKIDFIANEAENTADCIVRMVGHR